MNHAPFHDKICSKPTLPKSFIFVTTISLLKKEISMNLIPLHHGVFLCKCNLVVRLSIEVQSTVVQVIAKISQILCSDFLNWVWMTFGSWYLSIANVVDVKTVWINNCKKIHLSLKYLLLQVQVIRYLY